jgi:hypothetical protein
MRPFSSRRLLIRWVPAFATLALVAAACGGGGSEESPTATAEPTTSGPDTAGGVMELVPTGGDWAIGDGVNFAFATMSQDGQLIAVSDVTATFYVNALEEPEEYAVVKASQSVPGAGDVEVHTHNDGAEHDHGGEDAGRGLFYATIDLDRAGIWGLIATGTLDDGTAVTGNMSFQVNETANYPVPGDTAVASDNLTKFDVDDVGDIDTGSVPNDLHEAKIKDSMAAGRPLVIAFATPGFCQTQFCGPVVQELEALQEEYADSVDFVHIEIWIPEELVDGDDVIHHPVASELVVNPAVSEWLAQDDGGFSEPWVYVVDSNGTIFDRWEGPSSRAVMEESVKAVAEGATYGSN